MLTDAGRQESCCLSKAGWWNDGGESENVRKCVYGATWGKDVTDDVSISWKVFVANPLLPHPIVMLATNPIQIWFSLPCKLSIFASMCHSFHPSFNPNVAKTCRKVLIMIVNECFKIEALRSRYRWFCPFPLLYVKIWWKENGPILLDHHHSWLKLLPFPRITFSFCLR